MADIYPCLLPSKAKNPGEQRIYIAINHRRSTVYLKTRVKISSSKLFKNGRVVDDPESEFINKRIRKIMNSMEERIDMMPLSVMEAKDIKTALEYEPEVEARSFNTILKEYTDQMKADGRKAYADNYFLNCSYFTQMLRHDIFMRDITPAMIDMFDRYLRNERGMRAGVKTAMCRLRAFINYGIKIGAASYEIHPFQYIRLQADRPHDCYLTAEELALIRDADIPRLAMRKVRDLFMLSFYLGGLNFKDLMTIDFSKAINKGILSYVRSKTRNSSGNEVKLTVTAEAKELIDRLTVNGHIKLCYSFAKYEDLRSRVTVSIKELAVRLGIESPVCFYSARKSFVQLGVDMDIPLYILEAAIGQTVKDKRNRPIYSYFRIMQPKVDDAVRRITDSLKNLTVETHTAV